MNKQESKERADFTALEPLLENAVTHIADCNGNKSVNFFKVNYLGSIANSLAVLAILKLAEYRLMESDSEK